MTKQELRKEIRIILKENQNKFEAYSNQICQSILQTDAFSKADIILGYMSLSDEVDVVPVMNAALENGKKVYIPRIIPNTSKMDFYEYSKNMETSTCCYGIEEPLPDSNLFEIKKYDKNILVLVPGRLFSEDGNRLGRGKGYYDTFLSSIIKLNENNLVCAGICFSLQLSENIPVEAHDIKMNLIIHN